ncbi:RNA 3'-terminal phosphate cyclase domain-containing protein [Plasmodiophora brassicae]|uniref:RNA 3'-terminal phosphate cyclase domain-containing protein n=1 Tax=Plasmodiophora brassicae TaxID=37360 RepID=A0A0G4IZC1_PLABS|nr:hypothetical protein PBRA_001689 [Plasmodiophora brassicae]
MVTKPANKAGATSKTSSSAELLTCTRRNGVMRFRGAQSFPTRVVLATLSSTPIVIDDIRALDEKPGISEPEESLLRLLEKVTNGSRVEIGMTGTQVRYRPGFIVGGADIEHDCHPGRAIGYYLEALLAIAPFAKFPISITLRGVCNEDLDRSVDLIRTVTLPLLRQFGIEDGIELKIKQRGAAPLGGGEVYFRCSNVHQLKAVDLTDAGKVKRIRGIAYTTRVSPTLANRVVDSARGMLNNFIPDVWIYTDHYKGKEAGLSPGFALSLIAESTTGCLLAAERNGSREMPPESLGDTVAKRLLSEIASGACVDTHDQPLVLLYMTLCPDDVSRVRFGKLTRPAVQYLRHLRDFFGVVFRFRPDPNSATVVASCRGVAYRNIARRALA